MFAKTEAPFIGAPGSMFAAISNILSWKILAI